MEVAIRHDWDVVEVGMDKDDNRGGEWGGEMGLEVNIRVEDEINEQMDWLLKSETLRVKQRIRLMMERAGLKNFIFF